MIRFEAYSDYLCPWCWNASRRLWRLADEFEGRIQIDWRAYLLRPSPRPVRDAARTLEKFRRYTESWQRPAAEPDAGRFQIWASEHPPPSHSVPAHCAAKAAARVSPAAFRALHERLMTAYFTENRDISSRSVLEALWDEVGLSPEDLGWAFTEAASEAVQFDFEKAQALGATGAPGLRRCDSDIIIVGAQPIEVIRRWFEKSLRDGVQTPADA